jgi:hypothetical protein
MQSGTLNIALNTDGLLMLNRFLTDCFIELESSLELKKTLELEGSISK